MPASSNDCLRSIDSDVHGIILVHSKLLGPALEWFKLNSDAEECPPSPHHTLTRSWRGCLTNSGYILLHPTFVPVPPVTLETPLGFLAIWSIPTYGPLWPLLMFSTTLSTSNMASANGLH